MSESKSANFFGGISDKLKGVASGVAKAVGQSSSENAKNTQDGGARRKPKSGMLRLQRSRTRSAARAGGKRSSHKRSTKRRSSGKRSSGKRRSSKRSSGKRSRSIKGGIGAML